MNCLKMSERDVCCDFEDSNKNVQKAFCAKMPLQIR